MCSPLHPQNPYSSPSGLSSEHFRPQPSFGPVQGNPPVQSQLSQAALFSLLAALFAPLLSCLCIPTILLSLGAIVLGHVGLSQIRRSQGRLHGTGLAITGLALGYPQLLISAVMSIGFVHGFIDGFNKGFKKG